MKNAFKILILLSMVILGVKDFAYSQVNVSLRIGNPPNWAPIESAYSIRYYYLPELDAYYDVQRSGYFYSSNGSWNFSTGLPENYKGYDFYSGPKIEVNYFGDRPFEFFRNQREVYCRQYHPGGHLDFTGNYLNRRGEISGWDRRFNRHQKREERREERKERREDRDRREWGEHREDRDRF